MCIQPLSSGAAKNKKWDKWLDGKPFSECGCLPDLSAVIALMEHLQGPALQAARHLSTTQQQQQQQQHSKAPKSNRQPYYRGYSEFGGEDGGLGLALLTDPSVCGAGWKACIAAFPGTEILEVSPVRYCFVLLASRGGRDHRVFACEILASLRSLALRSWR